MVGSIPVDDRPCCSSPINPDILAKDLWLRHRILGSGPDGTNIKFGNCFTQDGLPGETFDYFLCNPPFGVEWKKVEKQIRDEYDDLSPTRLRCRDRARGDVDRRS